MQELLTMDKQRVERVNFPLSFSVKFLSLSFSMNSCRSIPSRVSCINSLMILLWPIHAHSHKYLYQLAPTSEQKSTGKTQHIYLRKTHETKMADFNFWRCFQALHLPGKMFAFLVFPCWKTVLKVTEHFWTKIIGGVGEKCLMNKLIIIEWVSVLGLPPKLMEWLCRVVHEQKRTHTRLTGWFIT